jgi:AcrR family transcriptional regulator
MAARTYDATATRERIFAAAVAEFATHGIAGARMDRIAAGAKANKQAIYLYFGSKDLLFNQVLQRSVNELAAAVPVDGGDIGGYAQRIFDYHLEHPQVLRLLMWESLELGERDSSYDLERVEHYRRKVEAIADAQAAGTIASDLDPGVLMLCLHSILTVSFAFPQIRRMLLGEHVPIENAREGVAQVARALSRVRLGDDEAAPPPGAAAGGGRHRG